MIDVAPAAPRQIVNDRPPLGAQAIQTLGHLTLHFASQPPVVGVLDQSEAFAHEEESEAGEPIHGRGSVPVARPVLSPHDKEEDDDEDAYGSERRRLHTQQDRLRSRVTARLVSLRDLGP
jgi:hypothetical protein